MTRKVQAVEARLKQMDEQGESQQSEEKQLKQQAEEKRAEEARIKAQIAEVSKGQEKLTNKRSLALQKRDNSLKKIQVRTDGRRRDCALHHSLRPTLRCLCLAPRRSWARCLLRSWSCTGATASSSCTSSCTTATTSSRSTST